MKANGASQARTARAKTAFPTPIKVVDVAGRTPPHSVEAEESTVAAVLSEPSGRVLADVRAILGDGEGFYGDAVRRIYGAACAVVDAGQPIDLTTIVAELQRVDRLQAAGGITNVTRILSATPSVANVVAHARIVLEKARMRRAIELAGMLSADAFGDYGDAQSFLERAERGFRELATDGRARRWPTPGERLLRVAGPAVRLPTGLGTLDEATRGGLQLRKVVAFLGAPGVGKSMLAVDLAYRFARAGVHVAILAADEPAEGHIVRLGQLEGFHRKDLEDNVERAREVLAARLDEYSLDVVDQEEDGASIEDVSSELVRRAKGAPSVLVVDSAQTARGEGSAEARDPRQRVDAIVASCKRAAAHDGHLVLLTSEVSRGVYRSTKDRPGDLAAGKESGAIEYGVSMQLVLHAVEGADGFVDVGMPKNRMGEKTPFRLKLERARARFAEVPMPEPEPSPSAEERGLAVEEKILAKLARRTDLRSKNDLAREVGGRRKDVLEAFDRLLEKDRVRLVGGFFRRVDAADQGGAP